MELKYNKDLLLHSLIAYIDIANIHLTLTSPSCYNQFLSITATLSDNYSEDHYSYIKHERGLSTWKLKPGFWSNPKLYQTKRNPM